MMVLKVFHKANLGFLLYRLVGRAVFANPEGVVRPDKLHRKALKGGQPNSWLHIVREHEESGAGGDHPSVQSHPVADTGHGQFANAGLQESTGEIIPGKSGCVFKKPIGLVTIGQVCRGNNHVLHVLRQMGQHSG